MTNSENTIQNWIMLLSSHTCVPFGPDLRQHFEAGEISRICDCGCNSFDIQIPECVELEPLVPPNPARHGGAAFCEIVLSTKTGIEVCCIFFADSRGFLSGVDITNGVSNHAEMPEDVEISEVKYTTWH